MKVFVLVFLVFLTIFLEIKAKFNPFIGAGPVNKKPSSYTVGIQRFPELKAINLDGRKFNLPADFGNKINLVVIGFKKEHQLQANTWIYQVKPLLDKYNGLGFYVLPTIEAHNISKRLIVNNRIRDSLMDQDQRQNTIPIFLDKESFKRAMGITSEEEVFVALIRADGNVIWSSSGIASTHKVAIVDGIAQQNIN